MEDPVWNPGSSTYSVPSRNLRYIVSDTDNIMVADPGALPPQLSLCVVDTVTGICTLLLNLDSAPASPEEAEKKVADITRQDDGLIWKITGRTLSPAVYLDNPAWNFSSELSVVNNEDTVELIYSGVIFSDMALVVTGEKKTVDSIQIASRLNSLHKSNN